MQLLALPPGGGLLAFVPHDTLKLQTPEEDLSTCTFNNHVIKHYFCTNCGNPPFGEGVLPNGDPMASINLRCIPVIDLGSLEIVPYDGVSR